MGQDQTDENRREAHLRTWREQVHPPGWRNPTPEGRYNLVVIGAGPAGLVCAAGAAALGAKVALVERHQLGGDCLNVGCVPSKGLIRAARAAADARRAGAFGVDGTDGARADFPRAMERMVRIRAELAHHDSAERFTGLGVDVYLGEARFTGKDTVAVAGQTLSFKRAVIATGARAVLPDVPGLAACDPLTNETVFDLTELPPRLAVIGSGPIGMELGQAFARLGSSVTVLEQAERIMGREEKKAARIVHEALVRDGVDFRTGVTLLRADAGKHKTLVIQNSDDEEESIEADAILVAAGRAPNVGSLNLDAAGVAYNERFGVRVNARLRTSNKRVYAAGDVCHPYKFTHAADACARIVLANALFYGRQKATGLVIPWATYTQPEVAHVGLTEAEAASRRDVRAIEVETRVNDRSRLDGDDSGYARVYLDNKGRILGATLVAEHAGDMIGEMVLAITHGMTIGDIGATIHPYPTNGEIWKKVADQAGRERLTPTVEKWLSRFLALTR